MAKSAGSKAKTKKGKHRAARNHEKKDIEDAQSGTCSNSVTGSAESVTREKVLKNPKNFDYEKRPQSSKSNAVHGLQSKLSLPDTSITSLAQVESTMPMQGAEELAKLVEPQLDDLVGARESRYLTRTKAKDGRSGSLVVRPSNSEGDIVHPNCQEASPLLGLPAELRDRIYEYTVFEPHAIDTYSKRVKIQKKSKKERKGEKIKKGEKRPRGQEPVVFPHMKSTPPLAATCRQLRNEVLPVYFSCNTFAFRYDLHYVSSNIRTRQILSFKYRIGLDIRWIRKVKCALVSIISPKPSPDHMYCESTVTAERKRFGCRIMITVQQSILIIVRPPTYRLKRSRRSVKAASALCRPPWMALLKVRVEMMIQSLRLGAFAADIPLGGPSWSAAQAAV